MNIDTFFQQIEGTEINLEIDVNLSYSDRLLDNEALFQLPLISLIILLMAKDKRKPYISELGQLVGESIETSMPGFKGSAQHIGWSSNLRVRTVKAMVFLEHAKLVEVHNRKSRVQATELGRKVIDRALKQDDNLSYNLMHITRAYRNICVSKQLDLEVE